MRFLFNFYRYVARPVFRAVAAAVRALSRKTTETATAVSAAYQRRRATVALTVLISLFLLVYFSSRILVFVKSGQAAVHYRLFGGGTRVDRVYGEGIHFIFPWDSMQVYDVRVQERDHTVEVLTRNGLKLKFLVSIRYQPPSDNTLAVLHQQVGTDYVDKIVIPEVVSALRTHVGTFSAEEVITTKRAILDLVFNRAIDNVAQRYVTVDRVIIQTIELPASIEEAVEDKIEQRHIAESYEYRIEQARQEAVRKEIEAQGHRVYNETIAASLTDDILRWKGIEATREIATSENSKVIVIGNGDQGLPVILGADK